jgi:hypothetical protein
LEPLAFDEYCRFDTSACASAINRGSLTRGLRVDRALVHGLFAKTKLSMASRIIHRSQRVPSVKEQS